MIKSASFVPLSVTGALFSWYLQIALTESYLTEEEKAQQRIDSMINGGEISGKNFLMKKTFEYAKYRVKNRKENETIDDSYSVVVSPKEHPSTEEEIKSVTKFLKPEYSYKLSAVTLEDFVNTMIHTLPGSYASVYERFWKYLDFEKTDL